MLYTDEPCGGGIRLDIHTGVADPTALQRAHEALDQSTAERRVANKREAARPPNPSDGARRP